VNPVSVHAAYTYTMRSRRPRRRETMHNACSNLPAPSRVHTHTRLVTSSNLMHCSMLLAITTRHPQHTQINTRPFHCGRHADFLFFASPLHHRHRCFMLQVLALSGELHCRRWFSCSPHTISSLRCLVVLHGDSYMFSIGTYSISGFLDSLCCRVALHGDLYHQHIH
jgi:hypothetical protein